MRRKNIAIHSVPRSGSSWLGQIFNSSPQVIYRYQPLFSYEFKDDLNEHSSDREIQYFFNKISKSKSPFLSQIEQMQNENYPKFEKNEDSAQFVVYKEVRYHNLLRNLLEKDSEIKIIGLIRNPLAVINSWLRSPKEFRPEKGWKEMEEWRYALNKNQGRPEEFHGYEKWKEVAKLFQYFKQHYSNQFYLLKYDSLLKNTLEETQRVFDFCEIPLDRQTICFINESCENFKDDRYSVFRYRPIDNFWKDELNPIIAKTILDDLKETELQAYVDDL